MNFFYQTVSLTFLTVGAVVGAGFISGREIVAFFGTESFLPFIIASFFILSGFFYTAYSIRESARRKKDDLVFGYLAVASSFISACGVLAGLDFLFATFCSCRYPVLSVSSLIVVSVVSVKGISGVEKFTLAAVPFIIIIVVRLILGRGEIDFSTGNIDFFKSGIKTVLYASMNFFVNFPAMRESAKGKSQKARVFAAFLSSAILCFLAAIIAAAVKGGATQNTDAPLMFAVGVAPIFSIALFFALETSLFSAYYPAFSLFTKKRKVIGGVLVGVSAFIISRIGVKGIIDGLYPIIGAFGTAYLFKIIAEKFSAYKKRAKDNNK